MWKSNSSGYERLKDEKKDKDDSKKDTDKEKLVKDDKDKEKSSGSKCKPS